MLIASGCQCDLVLADSLYGESKGSNITKLGISMAYVTGSSMASSTAKMNWGGQIVTDYVQIERWWQVVMSAYLMVSLHFDRFELPSGLSAQRHGSPVLAEFVRHRYWNTAKGWKHLLNNLRLVMQPFVLFNLVQP